MAKAKTNQELVEEIMQYSKHGALAEIFVIHAIRETAERISKMQPEEMRGNFLISGEAWVGVAKEIHEKMSKFYKEV